jgi:hypothetical protein
LATVFGSMPNRRAASRWLNPLDMAGVSDPRVQLHRLHPHPSGRPNWPEDTKATDFHAALAGHASGRFSEGFSLRRSQHMLEQTNFIL